MFSKDKFRWSVSSLGCPELNFNQFLSFAQNNNLGGVELRTLSGTTDITQELEAFIQEQAGELDFIVKNNYLISINTSFKLCKNSNKDLSELIRLANIADRLNCKYLRVFGGFDFNENLNTERLELAANALTLFQQIKDCYGLKCSLVLEMHDGFSSSERILKLIDFYGHYIPIIWDVHHSFLVGKEDIAYTWNSLKRYIVHVHIKDSIVIDNSQNTFKTLLPGTGVVPGRESINLLRKENYDKTVSLEWEKFWEPSIPNLDQALKSLVEHKWV